MQKTTKIPVFDDGVLVFGTLQTNKKTMILLKG